MTRMIAQILLHTPTWVYGLFVVLIVFGLQQTRSRNVNAFLAYLLPAGMIVLSLAGINSSFGIKPVPITLWALGLITVSAVGFKYFRDDRVTFSRSNRSFFIPGSWTPFFVIMAIFFTKYAFAVMQGFGVAAARSPITAVALSLIYGCLSGYFVARASSLVAAARRPRQTHAPRVET